MAKDPKFPFYLSNSMLRDWEVLCPKEWYQRWVKKNPIYEFTSDAMEMGNVFETMVIGVSVGGRVTTPSDKLKKSVYYQRIIDQSKTAKEYLKLMGGKKLSVQEYLYGIVIDSEGREVPVCGNLDIRYGWPEQPLRGAVIDLKFSGDTENTFGKFSWGKMDQMDCSQAIQYRLLHKLNFPKIADPEFYYMIFDSSAYLKKSIIKVNISEQTEFEHIDRLSKAYHEISDCMLFDSWAPIQQFSICSTCKVKCEYEVLMPEIIEIEK